MKKSNISPLKLSFLIAYEESLMNVHYYFISFTNEINKQIDPRPPSSDNDHDIVQTH